MFKQSNILTLITVALTLSLTNFPANSQSVQEGSQDASIEGNDNEINQIINQYYFNNPGQGSIKRGENTNQSQKKNNSSDNRNSQQTNSNNSEWGKLQGEQRNRNSKK